MPQDVDIRVPLDRIEDLDYHKRLVGRKIKVPPRFIKLIELTKRSVDARKQPPVFQMRYRTWVDEKPVPETAWDFPLQDVHQARPVVIVGFGPAGMFAALQLIELGFKPIVVERGKGVRERRRDLAALNKEGVVNPDSNYCFGEGGAGTFSDGKLYTRSKKRGDIRRVLEVLVAHGATRDILIDAHPHIGTNKLPQIIQSMRETILEHGGEIHFDQRVTDFILETGKAKGVVTAKGDRIEGEAVLLATGHSARDIFKLLHEKEIAIEAKPFALGVRVEHPQPLIDEIRYRMRRRHPALPAASYSLVTQARGKGVYSFCMCPGGIICPAATEPGEVVVNGWSPSKRNSPYSNSGIVVEVTPQDLAPYAKHGPLAAMAYQADVEQKAFSVGGGGQTAPAQRLTDFVNGKSSRNLPDCSYLPGLKSASLREVLPPEIMAPLVTGFQDFGRKMRGYLTREALVVGTESRTSSPVRIPRDDTTLMHPQIESLFPCGEGPGYAGGIMSAAMDGEAVARAIVQHLKG